MLDHTTILPSTGVSSSGLMVLFMGIVIKWSDGTLHGFSLNVIKWSDGTLHGFSLACSLRPRILNWESIVHHHVRDNLLTRTYSLSRRQRVIA